MAENGVPTGGSSPYPLPPASGTNLSFYRQAEQHQHMSASKSPSMEPHSMVPDDPQMRANLEMLMGGDYVATHTGRDNSRDLTSPDNQLSYVQVNRSPENSPQDKHRDKRTKVSRACDECRRKKIKCDATDESGSVACANCMRTGANCAFSRQPMRRGPNKGYIKELAERLGNLERSVHPSQMMQQQQPPPPQQHHFDVQHVQAMVDGMQAYNTDMQNNLDPRLGDKRSYEMAEALQQGHPHVTNTPQRPTGPATSHEHIPTQQNLQEQMAASQPFWQHSSREYRNEGIGLAYQPENVGVMASFDWDETVIDEYYAHIHQTFPLLPHSKSRLRQQLAECPSSLREAFLVAIDCLMRTFPTTKLPSNANYPVMVKRAAELLAMYPFENPSSHTSVTNLVYLQTLLLMALESDNHGPASAQGRAGPSRSEWLGRAAGVAGGLEINVIRTNNQSIIHGDRDSEDRLARRVWWVLFILDRWHASSTADLLRLPEHSVVLIPEDLILLGESTYHLARLSFIIGHLAVILATTKTLSTDVMSPSNPASALLGMILVGEIDRFRESVETVWGSFNLVQISYHHCHLLIKCLNRKRASVELVEHALKVATILNSRSTPVTPLNHHFGALAAMTLCHLCDIPETRTEAIRGLDQMVECLSGGRGLAGKVDSQGWDGAVRALVLKKREQMRQLSDGLHNLADVAGGGGGGGGGGGMNGGDRKFDPTMLTKHGYLTSLAREPFTQKNL